MAATVLSTLGGLLVLGLVCAFCLSVAAAAGLDAAALPLPVLAGGVVALLLAGYAGALHLGLLAVYAALLLGVVYGSLRAGKKALLQALQSPGFVFFGLAAAFFWVLFAVLQPMFTQWDEFTFWGTAAKMVKEQNMLYPLAPGNLKARGGLPGMALLSYFFQGLSPVFTEWQCLAAYDALFMACIAAASALPKRNWAHSTLLLGAGAVLPFFFGVVPLGTVSTVYANAMADVPLALLFGGTLCLYFETRERKISVLLVGLSAALLTAAKDMGFAYALIAVFAMLVSDLAGGFGAKTTGKPAEKPAVNATETTSADAPQKFARKGGWPVLPLVRVGVAAVAVLGVYLGWNAYVAAGTGASGGSVGSGGLSMGAVLVGGVKQLLGAGRTDKFAQLMGLMGQAFFSARVCALGSGVRAVAAITVVAAAAFLLARKGAARRRVAAVWGALAFCFGAFYTFHLILYNYNFSDVEALMLKDYARYIGPYYAGWMLAMLCLLGRAAAAAAMPEEPGSLPEAGAKTARGRLDGLLAGENKARLGAGALTLACLAVLGLTAWRGMPVCGFWSDADSRYELRRDVKNRAAAANAVLGWNDRVLVLSQGDDATRWYYYNYELTATVVRGFGGLFWGDDSSNRWDSDFMNLVESNNWSLYDYQAVTSLQGLEVYLREKTCDYLLIDRADNYLQEEFSEGFAGGLTAAMPATLYKIQDDGTAMTFTPVATAESGVAP